MAIIYPISLRPDEAHEASQGAYMQAAWLEERANNEPNKSKRRELLRRASVALDVGHRLRAMSNGAEESRATPTTRLTTCGYCDYDEAEGELMSQCERCAAIDAALATEKPR